METADISKAFWLWILANMLAFTALAVGSFILPALISIPGIAPTVLTISLPFSFMQWVALRRIFPISRWWILTIPLGMALAVFVFQHPPAWLGLLGDDESTAVITALYLVLGLAIGLPQWLILRRHFTSSSIWLLGSSAGVALGSWFVLSTGLINQSEFVSYLLLFLVYAIITGLVLIRMLDKHIQPPTRLLNTPLPLTGE
jgi:hypothetical protein